MSSLRDRFSQSSGRSKLVVVLLLLLVSCCSCLFVYGMTISALQSVGILPTSTPTPTKTPTPTATAVPTDTPVPPTATATNTPLPTNTPPPTATPQPPTATATETPIPTNTPTPAPTAVPTATALTGPARIVITNVNKRSEYVDIQNIGGEVQDLTNWLLRSERGPQDCTLSGIVLQPGQSIRIWAMAADAGQGGFNCGFGDNIWNNDEPDAAVLFNAAGEEVYRR